MPCGWQKNIPSTPSPFRFVSILQYPVLAEDDTHNPALRQGPPGRGIPAGLLIVGVSPTGYTRCSIIPFHEMAYEKFRRPLDGILIMVRQLTVISLYGQKPASLLNLIRHCSEFIQGSEFRRVFKPYDLHQIHGTFFGMERLVGFAECFNKNIWIHTGRKEAMNFMPLLETVMKHLPMTVRFGGFGKTFTGFKSAGKFPYERSFQVHWNTNKVTLIGWPHRNDDYTSRLLLKTLRSEITTKCKIGHKYDNDNDLFLVIGEISRIQELSDFERKEIRNSASILEEQLREYLENNMTDVEIGFEQVFIARYDKESLPPNSTNVYCINMPGIDAHFLSNLYV